MKTEYQYLGRVNSPEDVKKLVNIIKDEVFKARGILLEEEINIM